jgi:hypothetical protein
LETKKALRRRCDRDGRPSSGKTKEQLDLVEIGFCVHQREAQEFPTATLSPFLLTLSFDATNQTGYNKVQSEKNKKQQTVDIITRSISQTTTKK